MALLDIYKVTWQNNRHKYPDVNTDFVAVSAVAFPASSALQTNANDGKTITILSYELVRKGVIN